MMLFEEETPELHEEWKAIVELDGTRIEPSNTDTDRPEVTT